ncbi:MAG: polyphosphate polymerase domain-containing protein [Bacteroidetes bacterium]|nr:polyphosphate polymerase domain-containing protein [Bacteroidota bacterium]
MLESSLHAQLSQFQRITLEEMGRVTLMNRIDTKFAFGKNTLNQILTLLTEDYFVLEINGKRKMEYESLYFDDAEFSLFSDHHRGKNNRAKVRIRNYVDSNLFFFEVKHKIKGRTDKHRISTPSFHAEITNREQALLQNVFPTTKELHANITNRFTRITLVNKTNAERLTLDFDLSFNYQEQVHTLNSLVIAELKQERINRNSPFYVLMKSRHLRPYRLSKYCLGIMELVEQPKIKKNRFKKRRLHLEKINAHA